MYLKLLCGDDNSQILRPVSVNREHIVAYLILSAINSFRLLHFKTMSIKVNNLRMIRLSGTGLMHPPTGLLCTRLLGQWVDFEVQSLLKLAGIVCVTHEGHNPSLLAVKHHLLPLAVFRLHPHVPRHQGAAHIKSGSPGVMHEDLFGHQNPHPVVHARAIICSNVLGVVKRPDRHRSRLSADARRLHDERGRGRIVKHYVRAEAKCE
jgi:hypothetical protein